jgi:hypothetical protein
MEDIRSVLTQFQAKNKDEKVVPNSPAGPIEKPSVSEIPDVFFDVILRKFKLNRGEIALLMFLYRQVWSKPNLYRAHGISPLNSYADLSAELGISIEDLGLYLRSLQKFGLLETVRAGQYFVRRFFSEELDAKFGQNYDDFL